MSVSISFISTNYPDFALSTSFLGNGADAGEITRPDDGEWMAGGKSSGIFWITAGVEWLDAAMVGNVASLKLAVVVGSKA